MILNAILALLEGQVAKFDDRRPIAEYETVARLEDVERCLIRAVSPPQVYRQPDRPDDVTIVWTGVSISAGNAAGRIDLSRRSGRTLVRSWMPEKMTLSCAPRKM